MKLKAHIVFVTGLLFVLAGELLGQGLCDRGGGAFTLSNTEVCVSAPIKIKNDVPNTTDENAGYVIRYDKSTTQNLPYLDLLPSLTFSYDLPGEYTVLQRLFTTSGAVYHCENVKVIENRRVNIIPTSCGGGNISLVLNKDAILDAYDKVEVDWGDDSDRTVWSTGDDLNLLHTYADTDSKPAIRIKGMHTSGGCAEGIVNIVQVGFVEANLADIQISSLIMRDDNTLRTKFKGIGGITTSVKYRLATTSVFAIAGNRSANGDQEFDIKLLDSQKIYQIELESEDRCGGKLPSKTVTSMVVEGESSGGSNKISWNKYDENATGFQGYDLYANGELLKSFSSIAETEYTDTDVECGEFVSYHIVARLTGVTSQSAPIGIRVQNDLNSTITSARVSVDQDKVLILADVPGKKYTLNIDRADNGTTTYKRIMSQNDLNEYQDPDVRPNEKSYCYRFSYESCEVKFPVSEPICTILLKKDVSVLSWSPEQPFLDDLENYTVSQTSISGVNVETDRQQNLTFSPQFNNQSELEYAFLVKATSQNGNFESLSNTITYRRGAGVFVPTAFTPNDDIYNNTLFAVAEQVKSFDFTIMNRWGNVVFHTSNLAEGWDGKIDGVNAAVGSYVYKIVFVDDIDQKVEKRGTFMLLR